MLFQEQVRKVKQAAPKLAATTNEQRNAALTAVREALLQHQAEILKQTNRIWHRQKQMAYPVRYGNVEI